MKKVGDYWYRCAETKHIFQWDCGKAENENEWMEKKEKETKDKLQWDYGEA